MPEGLSSILAFCSSLGAGLIAGVFFAFSSFVMRALAKLPPADGLAAMQSINVVVVNPVFMAVFLGTAVLSVAACVVAFTGWDRPAAGWLLAGALVYLVGSFGVTIFFNVPLNDALAALDPAAVGSAGEWASYVTRWTTWNHVRTLASVLAAGCFLIAFKRVSAL